MKNKNWRLVVGSWQLVLGLAVTLHFTLCTLHYLYSQEGDTDSCFISGVSKYVENEYETAIPLLEKAYKNNKKNKTVKEFLLKVLVETAIICVTKNDYQNASYYFEKALKINPKDKKLQTMYRKNQVLTAKSKTTGTTLKSESKVSTSNAAVARDSSLHSESTTSQSPAVTGDTEKRKIMNEHFNRAVELFKIQKYKEAIREWEEVLKLDPNHKKSKKMIKKAKKKL